METVAVTGGNGTIGSAILAELVDRGYRAVNLSRDSRREDAADWFVSVDLLDAGEVYGALSRSGADAVIHAGTIAGGHNHPEHVIYRSNVMTTYHVLEAATALDLEAVCLASSINAVGYDFQSEHVEVDYLPLDESHRLSPRDPYALGKHVMEVTADGFGRRADGPRTIGSLRYPWVADEERLRAAYAERPRTLSALRERWSRGRNDLFTYLHVDDAAAVATDVIEADFEGHEVFWAVASDTTAAVPTPELVDEFYPDVERRRALSGHESLVSTEKAREMLGWEPAWSWRDVPSS